MSWRPLALLLTGVLCAASGAQAPATGAERLAVDPADPRLTARPELLARLTGSAHGYFRFINAAFAAEACTAFSDVVDDFPDVNLHGDAHFEQYAVTSIGFGLTDFDDCTQGKPIIDLVRFGTSLMLAAREHGWGEEDGRFLDDFFRGYRDALKKPNRGRPMPKLAAEIRAGFRWDHAHTLSQAHAIIDAAPLPPESFAQTAAEFAELIRFGRDDLPPHFFEVKRVGALAMGVGSALDEKYLATFEGWTEEDDDDLIVEAKQIRDLSGNPCLRTDVGASRILDGQRLIAYEPFAFSAVVPRGDKYFWIHDWTDDYQEASIATVVRSKKDLKEIAYDAGIQLGRAHPKRPDGSPDKTRQKATLEAVERFEGRIRGVVRRLANETEAAWRDFTEAAGRLPND
jgi:hypothetical protein